MKRKSITLTICILAVLALASIGFASWIISNPEANDYDDGTIWVDNVASQVYTVDASLSVKEIQFGVPSGYAPEATDWLTNNSGKTDSLETVLTVVITPEAGAIVEDTLKAASLGVTLNGVKDGSTLTYDQLSQKFVDAGLAKPTMSIKDPTTDLWVDFTDGKIDFADLKVGATSGTCEIKITFGWGTNGNPYTYYNGAGHSYETDRTEAETFLNGVYEALNGLSYKITIK